MNTLELKTDLHFLVDRIENANVLKSLKMIAEQMFTANKTDFWDTLPFALQTEIEEGLSDFEKGDYVDNETMKQKYAQWL